MPSALVFCSVIAAFTGSIAFTFGMAVSRPNNPDQVGTALLRLVFGTFAAFTPVCAAGIVLALPVTWLAQRFRLESIILYLGAGTVAGSVCGMALMGRPRSDEFLHVGILRLSSPLFGGSWGLLWWLIHRRWRARQSA
jgi:di/tricarboxylate transporter